MKTLPKQFTKGMEHGIIQDSKEDGRMQKKLTIIGCTMWIIGLAGSIIGLNLTGNAKKWVSMIGNIVFLIGLGIVAVVWIKKKQAEQTKEQESKTKNAES